MRESLTEYSLVFVNVVVAIPRCLIEKPDLEIKDMSPLHKLMSRAMILKSKERLTIFPFTALAMWVGSPQKGEKGQDIPSVLSTDFDSQ